MVASHAGAMRTPTETMTAYFEGWRSHDAESLRDVLAGDVVFDGPMGHVEGVDENVASACTAC